MVIRLVQVGMGSWGRNWAVNVIRRSEDVALVGCVELDAELLVQAQQLLNMPAERCFQTLPSALTAIEADAVLITASLPAHVPIALEALDAGKHVLLEKPFAPTLVEAQQVVEMAANRNRVLMISQNYRFFPAVQTVTELIREEKLGSIGSVTIDFRRYKNSSEASDHRYHQVWQPSRPMPCSSPPACRHMFRARWRPLMRGNMCCLKSHLLPRSSRRNRWSKWLQSEIAC